MKTGLITHDRKFDFITQTQSLMNALSNITATDNQSKGIFFLAAFFKHCGEPYEQSVALTEPWPTRRWLCVAVQLCGVELCLVLSF